MKKLLTKSLLVAICLLGGVSSVWATDVPYSVGTEGTGDAFASRKYSTAYEIAPGETYHFTFTNTSYGSNNWNNWLLDCKATADTALDDWYFTMRSDNYGWGTSYNATMRYADFVWDDFKTVMNGATVDMYINYNGTDKIIRTYATITKGETEWHYNFASKAIDAESVFLFLSEELAVLDITTAEKVASIPNGTYTLYKRTTTTTDCGEQWKADDKDNIWVPNTTNNYFTYAIDGGLSLANTSANTNFKSAYSASRVLTPNEGSTVSMTAVATMGVASGRSSSYDYITIGGVSLRVLPQGGASSSCIAQVYIDGVAQGVAVSASRNVAYTFNVEINQVTGSVTYSVSGGATIAEATTLTSTAISNVVFGHSRGGSESYNSNIKLSNINITEQISAVSYANYTVHFVDNNSATIKDDEVRNGEVGAAVEANAGDKTSFIANDNKYVYSSDGGGTTVTANGEAEFTVTYTKYESNTYHINAQAAGEDILTDMVTSSAYFDGSTTAYWSKYIKMSDQWYVANETTYGTAITTATNNVAYTATDAIDYFLEFEDMTISRSYNALDGDTRASNGKATTLYGNANAVTISTVPAGIYTVSLNGIKWADGYADTYQIAYSTDNTNWTPIGLITYADGEEGEKTLENAIIPTAAYIRIWTTGGTQTPRRYLDYMTLKKTADLPATIPATLGANGYTTFASQYCLNLRNLPAGLKAYTATLSGVTLSFTECTQAVAAGTGLLLQGTGGETYNIPVVSTFTTVDNNALTGVTAVTPLKSDETNYIFAMKKATNATDELLFAPLTSTKNVNFPAGKAYITVQASAFGSPTEARALTISFGDEATGIQELKNSRIEGLKTYYDLQGRRVALPTKGLYIKDGRKVVIK